MLDFSPFGKSDRQAGAALPGQQQGFAPGQGTAPYPNSSYAANPAQNIPGFEPASSGSFAQNNHEMADEDSLPF